MDFLYVLFQGWETVQGKSTARRAGFLVMQYPCSGPVSHIQKNPAFALILCSHYFESPPIVLFTDKNDAVHPGSWRGKQTAKGENKVNSHSLSFAKLMAHEDSKPKTKWRCRNII